MSESTPARDEDSIPAEAAEEVVVFGGNAEVLPDTGYPDVEDATVLDGDDDEEEE